MVACFSLVVFSLSGCSPDDAFGPQTADLAPAVVDSGQVTDLQVSAVSDSSVTLAWTEVDDGSGEPATYRLKYAAPPIDWRTATVGCASTLTGVKIGAPMSCTVLGLVESSAYDFQIMSYRTRDGVWVGAVYSNVAKGTTAARQSPAVADLAVAATTDATLALRWTQVDDGTGKPAKYQVKYATPAITDLTAAPTGCGSPIDGTAIGLEMTCTLQGLSANTSYQVQVVSGRTDASGAWITTSPSNVASASTAAAASVAPGAVADLTVTAQSQSTLTVRWTQVDDGTGAPANYRVKYAPPAIVYASATIGCTRTITGTAIGAAMSCTIEGLTSATKYDIQLMSYGTDATGAWQNALVSNVATAATTSSTTAAQTSSSGIWLSKAQVAALPTSGSAWTNLLSEANNSCGSVDLADQDQRTNVCILAKALVFARTGTTSYRSDVVRALKEIVNAPTYNGRALALGRELGAYVLAADLIDLRNHDSTLDGQFRAEIRDLLTTYTNSGPSNLIACHEQRPNNWGTHCGASRLAVAAYLGDNAEIARAAQVFRGWLGDRSAYAGFSYGDLSWQCDPTRPVGINPTGCRRYGRDLGGILPDDQRRAGSYSWPPAKENYVWEALQGALMQAVILERKGYPAFQWSDQALRRAVRWLYVTNNYPAAGDDGWQPHLINRVYGTSFAAPMPASPGKNVGWTDWTHR